ncbi:hypothetical protein ALC57_10666 [Trachymyrmex cornetzi]|uniref:Uncharacterized protein n=1 Tax=Trachymyrmex cornetzi TaxID=471704 RepID=A0A151J414_9HYME|nr:hypothetical protein ALC57_10666 [Trachymyrmex cornetzi]
MFAEQAHLVPMVYLANISNNPTAAMRHTWLVGWFKVAKAKVVTPRPNWGILKMSFPRRFSHSVSNNWKRVMKASSPVKLIWNLSFYLFSFPLFLSLFSESTRDISPSSSSLLHPRLFRGSLRRELLLAVVLGFPLRSSKRQVTRESPPSSSRYDRSHPPGLFYNNPFPREVLACERTVEILLERLQPSRIGVTVRHKDNLQQRNAIPSRILGYIRDAQQPGLIGMHETSASGHSAPLIHPPSPFALVCSHRFGTVGARFIARKIFGEPESHTILRTESSHMESIHRKNVQVPESKRQSGRGRIGSAGGNVFLENVWQDRDSPHIDGKWIRTRTD